MKKVFFLALCFTLFISCEEKTVTKVTQAYSSGAKKREVVYKEDGTTALSQKVFQEDGNILMEGPMKEGKRNGEWKFYDYDGTLKSKREYSLGTYNGKYIEYHKNGAISIEGEYANGDRVGDWKKFNEKGESVKVEVEENATITPLTPDFSNEKVLETYPDGKVKTKIIYDETGTKQKSQKTYFPSGEVQFMGDFVDGKRSGKWTSYFESGKLLSVNYYLEGDFHGDYFLYHENGIIKIEGEYNFGTMTGSWKSYDTDGTLLSHEFYDADGGLMDKIK